MTIFAKRSNSFAERLNSFAERLNSFAEVSGLPYQHKYTNRFRTKALSSQQNRLLQTFDAFGNDHIRINCYKHWGCPKTNFCHSERSEESIFGSVKHILCRITFLNDSLWDSLFTLNQLLQTFDAFCIVHNRINCYKHSMPSASFTLKSIATNIRSLRLRWQQNRML